MSRILAAFAALATFTTFAAHAETSLQVHGLSKHTGTASYNEVNTGVSVRYQDTETVAYQAGFYKNSYSRTTVFVAANVTPYKFGPARLGGFAGVGTGYSYPVMVGAVAVVEFDSFNLTVRALPKVKNLDGVVAIEFGIKF